MYPNLSINLSVQTRRELQLVASAQGLPVRKLVRDILKSYLDAHASMADE